MKKFKRGSLVRLKGVWRLAKDGIAVDPDEDRVFVVVENLTHDFPGRDPLHSCRVLTSSGEMAEFLEDDLEVVR